MMRVGPYPVLGERLDGVAPGRRVRSRFVSETSSLPAGSALSELAALLLSTERFEDLVQGVAELSVRTVGSAATCGITLAQDGRVITVGSSDSLATQLDELQYEHRAWRRSRSVKWSKLSTWPRRRAGGCTRRLR